MIAENLAKIRAAVPADAVAIVAVTKTQSPENVREAFQAGLSVMGENRVQEADGKIAALSDLPLEWHLVGHLQSNKVKQAVAMFSLIHSVDSLRLAQEIDRCAERAGKRQDILLQVNVAGESTKSGIDPEQAGELAAAIDALPHLRLCGLMTIAPFYDDPEQARPVFREMRRIFESLKSLVHHPEWFRWLSMGMTHDYRVAVQEGANMIRIGTGLFGERHAR